MSEAKATWVSGGETGVPALPRRRPADVGRALVALTKPGILVLLLITAACAMVVAAGGVPPLGRSLLALVGLGLSCGSANAVNMWYDRDIDRVMERTRGRPLPTGVLRPAEALTFGLLGEVVSIALLWAVVGPLPALLSFLGYAYYVGIYTFWLKRRTPQNIVIGGAAGAFPPLVGWAAVTGHLSWAAWLMFLIVFLWTPPHFWALALYRQDDYRRAHIPMMPVVRGERATKWQSLAYAVVLLAASVALYLTHVVGVVYLAVALAMGLGFVAVNIRLLRERPPDTAWARTVFRFSLAYLTIVFAAMVLDVPHLLHG